MLRKPYLILVFLLAGISGILGQAPTGDITGTTSDPSGAVIAGAQITVTNPATNFQRTATSNESGVYSVPSLPPGVYSIRVEMKGFKSDVRKEVELQVGQVARLDFTLEVGNVSDVVEVTGGAPVLDTETTAIGTVIENRRIVDLPLNGRNYLQLASLIPGATTNGPASSQGQQRMGGARNSFALNVSGQRIFFNHYSLDGIENTDPNFNTYLFLPSLDALQEFKVENGIFPAEYGHGMTQVNVISKAGTNAIHGALFEFLRNAQLDAKNFFDRGDKPIPSFKRNQFGATVGGPVVLPKIFNGKNKLFFFFDYEGLRERKGLTLTSTLPFAEDRAGNFSRFLNPANPASLIYDPATRVLGADGKYTATPFPGNIIPASRISPTSAAVFQRFYPLPNNITSGYASDFLSSEGRRNGSNQQSGRVDWTQSSNSTFFFRYSHDRNIVYVPTNIPDQGNNNDVQVHQGALGHTWVLGPNKVNELKLGLSRLEGANIQQRAFKENIVKELNIPGVSNDFPLYYGIPFFQISNFANVGECNDCPFVNYDTVIQGTDNFSWTKGSHSMKFGADLRRIRYNQIGAVVPRGRFTFNGQYTTNPSLGGSASPQNAIADFLLGDMSNAEGQVGAPIANFRSHSIGLYFQDTWKVTPKLTLNYGLRWEDEPPYYDKHDAIVNIDFAWDNSREPVYVRAGKGDPYEGNPPFRLPSTVPYVRDGRFGRRAGSNNLTDFAPRLGVAYSLNSKTVIRSGAGIYYVRDIGNVVFDVVRNAPFTIRRNESANSLIPNLTWSQPFTTLGTPSFILINQVGEPSSYVGQWSFGVQRQLTSNMSLETTYLGSAGVHLRRLTSYNDFPAGPPGDVNARRPFPKYPGNFQNMNAPSHSNYHALQVRLQQRFSHGFTVLGSFSWSKSIDNGSGTRTTDGDSLVPANSYNLKAERGLSAFDFRRRLTTSFLYELPVGRGKALLGSSNVVVDALLGGWQIGGILTLQDGFPLTLYCGGGTIQNGGQNCYPDAVGVSPELPHDQRTVSRYFNTAAFIDRLPGGPQYRYGNNGRNNVIGPSIVDLDFSTAKTFHLTEQRGIEFRAEFFNLPNHPIFGQPGNTLRTSTYGVITGTRIDSRQIQFGLKLNF